MPSVRAFSGPPLGHTLAMTANRLLNQAANLPASAWDRTPGEPPADIAANMAAAAVLAVPVVDWAARTVTTTEAPVLVADDIGGRRRNIQVPGLMVVTSYPYAGPSVLLTATPSQHFFGGFDQAVRIRAQGANAGALEVVANDRSVDVDQVAATIARAEAQVVRYLEFVSTDLATWHRDLLHRLRYTVGQRAAFHALAGDLSDQLSAG